MADTLNFLISFGMNPPSQKEVYPTLHDRDLIQGHPQSGSEYPNKRHPNSSGVFFFERSNRSHPNRRPGKKTVAYHFLWLFPDVN